MTEVTITNKRLISSDEKFNHYVVSINGYDVRVHENINGNGFGLSMKDVCKVFNYPTIEELKQSKEWESLCDRLNTTNPLSRSSQPIEVEYKTQMSYSSPAIYAGGTLDQAVNLAENPYRLDDVVSFLVTHNGLAVLNQALVRGKIESNKRGNKIIIDPETRSVVLENDIKGIVGRWSFFDSGSIIQLFHKPSINQIDETQINGNNINFSTKNIKSNTSYNARIGVWGAKFDITTFPTKERLDDLEIGELYRDGDIIKMKIED